MLLFPSARVGWVKPIIRFPRSRRTMGCTHPTFLIRHSRPRLKHSRQAAAGIHVFQGKMVPRFRGEDTCLEAPWLARAGALRGRSDEATSPSCPRRASNQSVSTSGQRLGNKNLSEESGRAIFTGEREDSSDSTP
jgi:hypothetical protein